MCVLFFFSISPPTLSTLFPYTTLFRSHKVGAVGAPARRVCIRSAVARPSRTGRCGRFGIGELEVRHDLLDVAPWTRSEEHTSELQSLRHLVCRLLLEKKKKTIHADSES